MDNTPSNKPKLSLIKPEEQLPADITQEDISSLNVDKLRQAMLQGIYTIESCLFVQAGNEYSRVARLRDLVKNLEEDLFDEGTLAALEPEDKIRLYTSLLSDKARSLEFLQTLHSNIASGVETLNQIEKLKIESSKPKSETASSPALEDVKKLLLQKIREKSSTK